MASMERSEVEVRWPSDDGPWLVSIEVQALHGRGQCVGLHVEALDGAPITSTVLRRLPIARLVHEATAPTLRQPAESSASGKPEAAALVYRTAYQCGANPTKAVAETLGISRSAAAKRIARARQLGLLSPASQGVPPPSRLH